MTVFQRLVLDGLALANSGFVRRETAMAALENFYDQLEQKIPLCLSEAKLNDPPPPNWRAFWRGYSK